MDIIKDHLFETMVGGFMAIVPMFIKRTFGQYDRRINLAEESYSEILAKLHKIDKELTRVVTIIEIGDKR